MHDYINHKATKTPMDTHTHRTLSRHTHTTEQHTHTHSITITLHVKCLHVYANKMWSHAYKCTRRSKREREKDTTNSARKKCAYYSTTY